MAEGWPDLAGRLDGETHVLPVRVYFEDTDFSGIVYHGAFVRFLERGRSDFVRLLGVGHESLAAGDHGEPLAFAVTRLVLDYRAPARIDDVVEVHTRSARTTGVRMVLEQKVVCGGRTLVDAEVTVVLIDRDGRARRMPESLRAALAAGLTPP